MTAQIVYQVSRLPRNARKATSSGDAAALYMAGSLIEYPGDLWSRIAEGKRRDG